MSARCVLKRPGEPAEVTAIELELRALQGAVEGYAEIVPLEPGVILYANEDGLYLQLAANVCLRQGGAGGMDVLFGPVVVLGAENGEDIALTEEQAERWRRELDEAAVS